MSQTFTIGIGGAAGQGVATPGDIFAKIFSRRGLHLNAYNAYQSIIRGGHTFLTIRTGLEPVTNMGDTLDLLIPLNQDTMDRHLRLLGRRRRLHLQRRHHQARRRHADGVQLCPLPVSTLADITRNKVAQNTLAMGAALSMMGIGFKSLESVIAEQFGKKAAVRRRREHRRRPRRLRLRHAELQALRQPAPHDRHQSTPSSAATPRWPWAEPRPASNSTAPIP